MLEKLDKCPLCQSADIGHFITSKDYSISQEEFTIDQCHSCHLLFTNPRPDESSISRYYQSETYISHSDKSNSITDVLYKLVRNITLQQKLKLVNSISKKGKLLDYGCGTGYFLKTCRKNGWDTFGVEPETSARSQALQQTDGQIFPNLATLEELGFDVITLWHVLEHVHPLHEVLSQLVSLLDENSKLVIAVPNPKSYDAQKYGVHWAAYDLPRHLYHFNRENVTHLARNHGMKVEKILPMKFDSFYVSMLSERYARRTFGIFNSFINGYKSNVYANKTDEYSSLIYILAKN